MTGENRLHKTIIRVAAAQAAFFMPKQTEPVPYDQGLEFAVRDELTQKQPDVDELVPLYDEDGPVPGCYRKPAHE